MQRKDLEHLLRASGRILEEDMIIVIGSQSILGKFSDPPEELTRSIEANLIAKNHPSRTDQLNVIGEGSHFHQQYGYYADPVDLNTAILPRDWKSRLITVKTEGTGGITGLCLDPHDLLISKVAAYREKDIEFAKVMIKNRMVDHDKLLALAQKVINPETDLERSYRVSKRIQQLLVSASQARTSKADCNKGRYSGEVFDVSGELARQDVGKGNVVLHETQRLDKSPRIGVSYTIAYANGKGSITADDDE